MEFEATRPPNFIKIEGSGLRISIGLMSEDEFKKFSKKQSIALREHYLERKNNPPVKE